MTDRRHRTVAALMLAACVLLPAAMLRAEGPPIGTPEGFVNDRANILTAAQRQALKTKLEGYAKGKPFVQIAVLTIPSLGGDTVEDYAQRVFDAWKFGQKGKDNGVLLLVAVEDRKLRIHTGYGVEGKLTDATCGQIIRNEITPAFKRGDYNAGITAGVDAMAGIVSGEFDAESRWENTGSGDPGRFMFLGVMIAVIGGGLAGGLWKKNKVAAIVCLLAAIGVVWLLIFPCFAVFASVFAILSFAKGFGRATGRTGWFFAGGSGFGGGGGGGFGGFGGGGSGGGGASGGW